MLMSIFLHFHNIILSIVILLMSLVVIKCTHMSYCNQQAKKKNLIGKHVVVIGGSSGIGKSFASLAAKKGAHVTVVARDLEKLKNAAKEIANSEILQLDASNYEETARLVTQLDDKLPIDMLVNCAGKAICGVLEDLTVPNIKEMLDINFYGTLYPIKVLIERFKKRRRGIIVITSSQAALLGIYGMSVYSCTKFALRALAECLSMELSQYNCTITLALPPDTDTPGYKIENLTKPEETHLISESAGLFDPEAVAEKIMRDALNGKFLSSIGFESYLLTTLCAGMSPITSYLEFVAQCVLMSPIRLISCVFLYQFNSIIKNCYEKRLVK